MNDQELIRRALTAMERSYSPYSGFRVGAALLTKSGRVFTGCNIENAAFSPTVCAERTAFFKAVSEGETEFVKIAVVGGNDGVLRDYTTPCGVCRQVMAEFCGADFRILSAKSENDYMEKTLSELLPSGFSPKNLSE